MIPAYNCAHLLAESLGSVLGQDLGPDVMQIEVVDDCSTDDPAAAVHALAGDRVQVYRQPENAGAIATFNTCLERARGEIVHVLHGDDHVNAGFYERFSSIFAAQSGLGAAFSRANYIDDDGGQLLTTRMEQDQSGIWPEALDVLAVSNRIRPPAIAVRRSVYEDIGGFDPSFPHAADWEMWTRIAAHYPLWFETTPLATYRRHDASDTSTRTMSADNIAERVDCIQRIAAYLPEERRGRLVRKAFGYSALFAGRTALQMLGARQWSGALAQSRAAVSCLARAARPR